MSKGDHESPTGFVPVESEELKPRDYGRVARRVYTDEDFNDAERFQKRFWITRGEEKLIMKKVHEDGLTEFTDWIRELIGLPRDMPPSPQELRKAMKR